jgi:hypothetical protein
MSRLYPRGRVSDDLPRIAIEDGAQAAGRYLAGRHTRLAAQPASEKAQAIGSRASATNQQMPSARQRRRDLTQKRDGTGRLSSNQSILVRNASRSTAGTSGSRAQP